MAIEHAGTKTVRKPWGNTDLRPWSEIDGNGDAIGELWFQRADMNAPNPALLLKLLFTKEPLSIQVHPDDAYAQSMGMENGKSEAWYILSAVEGAKVAIGLKRRIPVSELRAAIKDGSIADLVQWHPVLKDDVILVPAGTIHALGAGLVVAEIQQRSDATFRIFDYGRARPLDVDNAIAVANGGPPPCQFAPHHLTDARDLLVASPHFVLERIDLPPKSSWELRVDCETWLLVLEGHARIGMMNLLAGETIYLDADKADVKAGSAGVKCLLAYTATAPNPGLLRNLDGQNLCAPASRLPQMRRRETRDRNTRMLA
jgi:mannose-6-phosphate isomerase